MKRNKIKVADILGKLLVYAATFGFSAIGGFILFMIPLPDGLAFYQYAFFFLAALIVCLNIVLALHEAGHLIFGLLSGYSFSSYRIGGFMWVKQEGKIRFRRYSLVGTGGQCLMIPPEKADGSFPVILYNLGGVIVNFVSGLVFVLLFLLAYSVPLLSQFLLLSAVMSFVMAVSNGIPAEVGGVANDGANTLELIGNAEAMRAFKIQLLISKELASGRRLRDMPSEWFDVSFDTPIDNRLCSAIAVFACNRLVDEERYSEADAAITKLLAGESNILELYQKLLTCDSIYAKLVTDPASDISHLYTKELQKFIRSAENMPSVLRTEYAIAVLLEKDAKKAEKIEKMFEKYTKKYPYPQEIEAEREMIEHAKIDAFSNM